jgi:hypothetical protein
MGEGQGGEEMIPTLILIVAVYVCFRFVEIGHRERRQGRWPITIFATVCACITVLLTYAEKITVQRAYVSGKLIERLTPVLLAAE